LASPWRIPSIAGASSTFAGAAGLAAARASDVRQNETMSASAAKLVERTDAGFAEPGGNAHRHPADAERFAEPGG